MAANGDGWIQRGELLAGGILGFQKGKDNFGAMALGLNAVLFVVCPKS